MGYTGLLAHIAVKHMSTVTVTVISEKNRGQTNEQEGGLWSSRIRHGQLQLDIATTYRSVRHTPSGILETTIKINAEER